jgi:hypothetical protein
MTAWEYLKLHGPSEDGLDGLGEEGWELVTVVCKGDDAAKWFLWVFKRPRVSE